MWNSGIFGLWTLKQSNQHTHTHTHIHTFSRTHKRVPHLEFTAIGPSNGFLCSTTNLAWRKRTSWALQDIARLAARQPLLTLSRVLSLLSITKLLRSMFNTFRLWQRILHFILGLAAQSMSTTRLRVFCDTRIPSAGYNTKTELPYHVTLMRCRKRIPQIQVPFKGRSRVIRIDKEPAVATCDNVLRAEFALGCASTLSFETNHGYRMLYDVIGVIS